MRPKGDNTIRNRWSSDDNVLIWFDHIKFVVCRERLEKGPNIRENTGRILKSRENDDFWTSCKGRSKAKWSKYVDFGREPYSGYKKQRKSARIMSLISYMNWKTIKVWLPLWKKRLEKTKYWKRKNAGFSKWRKRRFLDILQRLWFGKMMKIVGWTSKFQKVWITSLICYIDWKTSIPFTPTKHV